MYYFGEQNNALIAKYLKYVHIYKNENAKITIKKLNVKNLTIKNQLKKCTNYMFFIYLIISELM